MSNIVLLTGVLGAGKSTIAKAFIPNVYHVSADYVQGRAADRAFPYLRHGKRHSWSVWSSKARENFQMHALMYVTLEADCEGLYGWGSDIILEGCILSEDWFREPLLAELMNVANVRDANLHFLNLLPPAKVAADQARKRNRTNEKEWFDEQFMAKQIELARARAHDERWKTFERSIDVVHVIESILGVQSTPIHASST